MLKWIILLDSLILGVFTVVVVLTSKFVEFLEIEMELAVIAISCFSQFSVTGFHFICLLKDRIPNRAMAKKVGHHLTVKIPLIIFALALITAVVFIYVPLHSEAAFNAKLVDRYNRTQGEPDGYLDPMHERFTCCGVRGQRFVLEDPTVFQPVNNLTVKLPKSCCTKLVNRNKTLQCVYWNIRQLTCSSTHEKRVGDFKQITTILLGLSSLFKVFIHFSFKVHSDSLFN